MMPETTLRCILCKEQPVADALEVWGARREGEPPGWWVPFGCLPCLRREAWRSAGRLFGRLSWFRALRLAAMAVALPRITPTVWLADALAAIGVTTAEFKARQAGTLHALADRDHGEVVEISRHLAVLFRGVAQADGATGVDEWQAVRRALYLLHRHNEAVWQVVDPGRAPHDPPSEEELRASAEAVRRVLRPWDSPLLLQLFAQVAHSEDGLLDSERRLVHELCEWLGVASTEVEVYFGEKPNTQGAAEVLGVAETAGWGEIRRAYLKLAMENHPDRVARLGPAMAEAANERMKAINEAYRQLRATRSA